MKVWSSWWDLLPPLSQGPCFCAGMGMHPPPGMMLQPPPLGAGPPQQQQQQVLPPPGGMAPPPQLQQQMQPPALGQQMQQPQQAAPPAAAVAAAAASGAAAAPKSAWTEHTAPDGRKYYFNAQTKQSTYEKPQELLQPEVREMQGGGGEITAQGGCCAWGGCCTRDLLPLGAIRYDKVRAGEEGGSVS